MSNLCRFGHSRAHRGRVKHWLDLREEARAGVVEAMCVGRARFHGIDSASILPS